MIATISQASVARDHSSPLPFTGASGPLPISRLLRAYLTEAKYDTINALRSPAFALPFLAIPVAIYLLFGVVMLDSSTEQAGLGPELANYLFAGFSVVAVMMPGIFGGIMLSTERDANLLKLKRALPLPPGAYVAAKVLMSLAVAGLSVSLVTVAALVAGKITISLSQVLIIWATMIAGTIPFCALGLLVGSYTSGSAAPAFGNLLFLPMMWLSGIFIPLPEALQRFVVLWPAFHLDQLALNLAGIEQFSFIPASLAAGVLVGVTVLCGGLAVHRLARVG